MALVVGRSLDYLALPGKWDGSRMIGCPDKPLGRALLSLGEIAWIMAQAAHVLLPLPLVAHGLGAQGAEWAMDRWRGKVPYRC